MDSDRIKGTAKEAAGKLEGAAGDVFGDSETKLRGRAREAAGAAQDAYGQAKDAFAEQIADVGESAERALGSLQREVQERPLLALLLAALVGFVLAQLTSR